MTIMGMTDAGLQLLAKGQLGKTITFTKMKVGDGTITNQTLADMEDLINTIDVLPIQTRQIITDEENPNNISLKVTGYITQAEDDYYFRELGLFAKDPDTNEEVLYAYVNKGEDATFIPQNTSSMAIQELASMIVAIGNSKNIIVNCNTDLSVTEQVEGNGGYSLFDVVLKDHELTYEESEGFALQGTWVYKSAVTGEHYGYEDFYNQCLAEKAAATSTTTTLGSQTVATYNHANGHIYYNISDKSKVDTYFNSTGVAWFYGIDEENERIFLPRNNYYFKNASSGAGAYIAPQLPSLSHTHTGSSSSAGSHSHGRGTYQITGTIYSTNSSSDRQFLGDEVGATGAFSLSGVGDKKASSASTGQGVKWGCQSINFNAANNWSGSSASAGSHSHTISTASADAAGSYSGATVLPPSVNGLLYIVVGNVRQKNALVINGALSDALTSINNKKTEVLGDITTAKNSATGDVASAKTSAIADVNSAKDSVILTINGKISDASSYATAAQGSAELAEQYANLALRGQLQSDWNQTDSTSSDFIKNKPSFDNFVSLNGTQTLTNKTIDADNNTISDLTLSNFNSSAIATNLTDSGNISSSKIPTSQAVSLEVESLKSNLNTLAQNITRANPEWGTGLTETVALRTTVEVSSDNENLTVTSSYTGTQSEAGDIIYTFIYDGTNWKDGENNTVTLSNYSLTVTGTPAENDIIYLAYVTRYITTISGFDGNYISLTNKPTNLQTISNLVTSVSSASTDTQYPSAKLFYDTVGNIETLINAL